MRQLTDDDAEELGRLLWSSFGRNGDEGFASMDAALDEARASLAGKWGPIVWAASVLALIERSPAGAAVIVRDDAHGMRPLLAFLVTHPRFQRRGVGQQLVGEAMRRLDALGIQELHLAVSPHNHARSLYRRLGFLEEPRATSSAT
jgi:GNAT superfamily N-acetyltransferase